MSELPKGWADALLGELVHFKYGKGLPERARVNGEIPVFGSNGIVGYHNQAIVTGESIIIGRKGSVGEVHHTREACWPIDTTYYVDDLSNMPSRFWYYALKGIDLSGLNRATAIPGLNREDAYQVEFALPPLNEQKRIADKLDAVLERVDACRERLDRVPAILKRFRQSVLAAATSGKLTEEWREQYPHAADAGPLASDIHTTHQDAGGHKAGNAAAPTEDVHDLVPEMFPKGWGLVTLRDVVFPDRPITYGILKPGPELDEGVPYIRVADFPGDKLNVATIRKTSRKMDEEFKRSRLRPGDLLLSIRGTVGRLIVIPEELAGANITQDSARISVQPIVNRDFVLWYLRSPMAQERMRGSTKGVAVRGINIGDVRALQLPLPSREEQDEIVRRVEDLFAYADRLEARYATARAQVDKLTPALLAKAFRGELVPQDPNDEPARALLERIRAARAEQPKIERARKSRAPKSPRAPKEKAAMTKSRHDDDVKGQPYLAKILRAVGGPASAEELFKRAELPVTDFYKQLAWEIDNGHVRDDETKLEAA